ncbi:MAG: squalene/phytoene synthase family protein [Pseudomonadota bacterium]
MKTNASLAHLGPIAQVETTDDPKAYAKHLMTKSRSSFTLGMKAMARPRREAMYAIYAFCRVVDDIADEPGSTAEKRDLLNAWRDEIAALYDGKPTSLIGKALAQPVERFELPKREFLLMIDGMEADVNGPIRAPSLTELLTYTRQVAGTVGILSIRIFGVDDTPARDRFALNLADAFQLTNILRDVEEDAEIGRLYLPSDMLHTHGITTDDPEAVASHPSLRFVCRDVGYIARERFNEARRALQDLNVAQARPALMMMGVYEGYLDQMEALDFRRDLDAMTLSKWAKLARGLRYAFAFPKRVMPDAATDVPPLADPQR